MKEMLKGLGCVLRVVRVLPFSPSAREPAGQMWSRSLTSPEFHQLSVVMAARIFTACGQVGW